MQDQHSIQVCILGMGYVGLTLAIGLALAGYKVVGIEINPRTLDYLRKGEPQVHEPDLPEIYRGLLKSGAIEISDNIKDAKDASVFIVTVGTPLSANGHSTTAYIERAATDILSVLKPLDLVILRSTVRVGTTRNIIKPILDKGGKPYFLAMAPERTIEGDALAELKNLPQLVGGVGEESTRKAAEFFRPLVQKIVEVSSPEVAELAKIVCNTQRDLQFAYANEIALMAENFGVDALEVINAANDGYARSSLKKPGLVGGPCLEKDSYILAESIKPEQPGPRITMMARKLNESLIAHAVESVSRRVADPGQVKKVAILGLAFKGRPPTGDVRGSLAIPLRDHLRKQFPQADITGYDPVATREEATLWGLNSSPTLKEAAENAELIFIQTDHQMFCQPEFIDEIAEIAPGALVYDFWHCVNERSDLPITVTGLGRVKKASG